MSKSFTSEALRPLYDELVEVHKELANKQGCVRVRNRLRGTITAFSALCGYSDGAVAERKVRRGRPKGRKDSAPRKCKGVSLSDRVEQLNGAVPYEDHREFLVGTLVQLSANTLMRVVDRRDIVDTEGRGCALCYLDQLRTRCLKACCARSQRKDKRDVYFIKEGV